MTYKIYLILFSILLFDSQAVFAQEQRYRVELLVLRHLDGYSASEPVSVLRDFASALDLLAPSLERATPEGTNRPVAAAERESATLAGVQAAIPGDSPPLPPITLMETRGEIMQQSWRRLQSANGLRPELYMSWEQAASAGSRVLRIHDQDLLFEQGPSAGLTGAASEVSAGADAAAELLRYYRLDGTARLRVSRFLNLDLDIELREPAQSGPGTLDGRAWTIHAIRQSRQFQLQNMQYFDGPVIAVLALVSRVEPLPEEAR